MRYSGIMSSVRPHVSCIPSFTYPQFTNFSVVQMTYLCLIAALLSLSLLSLCYLQIRTGSRKSSQEAGWRTETTMLRVSSKVCIKESFNFPLAMFLWKQLSQWQLNIEHTHRIKEGAPGFLNMVVCYAYEVLLASKM